MHSCNKYFLLLFLYIFLSTGTINAQSDTTLSALMNNAKTDEERVIVLIDQSKKYNYSNPGKSFEFARQALDLSVEIEFQKGKAEALRRIGIYHIYHNDYPKALENIAEALKISEDLGDKELISKCLMNMGSIYYENRDFNQAINYFSKSLRIAKEINDKQEVAGSLTNFGNVYTDMGDFKLAIENYQNALKLYVDIQDKQGISKSLFNIGNVYFYQNNFPAALNYYQKSIKIDREENDKLDIIVALNNIGKVYLKMNQLDKALEFCTQSLDLAWEVNSQDDISQASYALATIYKKKDDYKTALGFYQLATNIKETIYNENKNKEFGKLESKFQLEKQESQIKLLKKDKALKEEQAQKELLVKNIIIAGILMFSMIAVSVILYYKNRKEHQINLKLKRQNKEIIAQAEALKTLNEELDTFVYRSSHDLKAPLTSVLGLISILQIDVKEPDILKFLEKIKWSVDKLMLVLHDLTNYSKNSRLKLESSGVNFNEIVNNVLDELHYVDKFEKVKIEIEINNTIPFFSDPIRIDILLTCLISNAIIHNDISKPNPYVLIQIKTDAEKAVIIIKDNGKGISDIYKDKVYEMFFKGSNESQGSGLGLYIAKGVIKKLNGTLTYESEEKKGTVFIAEIANSGVPS